MDILRYSANLKKSNFSKLCPILLWQWKQGQKVTLSRKLIIKNKNFDKIISHK
jgi:hypothetical protein